MEAAAGMTRAELHFFRTVPRPQAVLVLCPGANGSGEKLIGSPLWQDFARENNLGLVGLSFASPGPAIHDGTGYYYAAKGSGEKLLEGIRQIYGKDLPLLLYGISGGAHFTSRFEEWRPDRVLTWCAYSAGWWDKPRKNAINPPGIVACGEDDPRLGASLIYFKSGRAMGKPWLWICLPDTGHAGSAELDDFVRHYFSLLMSKADKRVQIVDIDQKLPVSKSFERDNPAMTGRLPSSSLFPLWCKIHEP